MPASHTSPIRLLPSLLAFCLFFLVSAERAHAQAPSHPRIIQKITFTGNRTSERVLRRHLPFTEGDALNEEGLDEAAQALYDMRLFKKVAIATRPFDGGLEVAVTVEDGWYVIPFPFASGGSGGGSGGLFLSSRNVFREAESISALVVTGSRGARAGLFANWEGWSVETAYGRSEFTERQYADGAFSSTSGSRDAPDEDDPPSYGTVTNRYEKKIEQGTVGIGIPLGRGRRGKPAATARFGWKPAVLHYSNVSNRNPGGAGHLGEAYAGLRFGGRHSGFLDGLGAIMGFGLADIETRLKPLRKRRTRGSADLEIARADEWTHSDDPYTIATLEARTSVSWGHHNNLSFNIGGSHGESLLAPRLVATNSSTGLRGTYAREYRGHTALGANVSFSRPFRTTRRGIWQGSVFIEGAAAWDGERSEGKQGIGTSFFYRFWRFPLPLGLAYTYSIDDSDAQITAAVGGRF